MGAMDPDPRRRIVSRDDVEHLWADVLEGRRSWEQTPADAIELVEMLNPENPIVNSALLDLYDLRRFPDRRTQEMMIAARQWFRDRLAGYDADPVEWERQHFLRMLRSHRDRYGSSKARSFARRIHREGSITLQDVGDIGGGP